jgi:hypothetical protein
MASGMYNRFKYDLMAGEIDLEDDALVKAMLLDNSHSFTATHNVKGDVNANELAAAGNYTTGGKNITNRAITQGASTKWDGDDVEWAAATFSAWHTVLYDDTHATDDLICSIDFGGEKIVSAGTFKIQWHVNGIVTLATV